MSRGFLIVFYTRQPFPPGQPREQWVQMLTLSCLSFRAHNPGAELLVMDIDGAMALSELIELRRFARVHTGPGSRLTGEIVPWTHSNLDKTLALAHSPFDETCQIDLDLLWTGPASDVWDAGRADLTLCYYDRYTATWTNVSTGVVVCRNRDAIASAWKLAIPQMAKYRKWAAQADEVLAREAWYAGGLTADLMPGHLWQMDWQAWFPGTLPGQGPLQRCGALCSWPAPLQAEWDEPIDRVFHCGDLYPRSFHFTGNKARILACPRAARYREKLLATL